jgi:hypothetical protein
MLRTLIWFLTFPPPLPRKTALLGSSKALAGIFSRDRHKFTLIAIAFNSRKKNLTFTHVFEGRSVPILPRTWQNAKPGTWVAGLAGRSSLLAQDAIWLGSRAKENQSFR